MVGHAETQRPDSRMLQHTAQPDLSLPFAVPLRQHHHSELPVAFKIASVNSIVRLVGSLDVTGKRQYVPIEMVLRGGLVSIERITVCYGARRILTKRGLGIVRGWQPNV